MAARTRCATAWSSCCSARTPAPHPSPAPLAVRRAHDAAAAGWKQRQMAFFKVELDFAARFDHRLLVTAEQRFVAAQALPLDHDVLHCGHSWL